MNTTHLWRPVVAAPGDPLARPDRIAVCGDWHGNISWAVGAINYAYQHGADTVVHVGDFGYLFDPWFLRHLSNALAAAGTPLLFADGNHEDHRWLARKPIGENGLRKITDWIWHMPRGFRWQWGAVRFLALGGAYSVDGALRRRENLLWQPEESITDEQAAQCKAGGPVDVLISHDCPSGVNIPGLEPDKIPFLELLRAEEHRAVLRSVVDVVQPATIFHGHYHRCYRRTLKFAYGQVKVFGLGSDESTFQQNVRMVNLIDLWPGLPAQAVA